MKAALIIAAGFNMYHQYNNNNPTPENHLKLAKVVEDRKDFIKELEELKKNEEYLQNWFPEWKRYMELAHSGGKMYGQIDNRPPFNGEF